MQETACALFKSESLRILPAPPQRMCCVHVRVPVPAGAVGEAQATQATGDEDDEDDDVDEEEEDEEEFTLPSASGAARHVAA